MDPDRTCDEIVACYERGEILEACEHAQALAQWIWKGGVLPDRDKLARALYALGGGY
jgi:hypothetical protein